MKTTLAILFSLMLAWTQSVSACLALAAPAETASGQCCSPCTCAVSCCVESSEPDRQPAAPPPAATKLQWQFIQALCCTLLEAPAIEQPKISPQSVPADSSVAVPLYTRHCAYLI
jgi:hypothetical protein